MAMGPAPGWTCRAGQRREKEGWSKPAGRGPGWGSKRGPKRPRPFEGSGRWQRAFPALMGKPAGAKALPRPKTAAAPPKSRRPVPGRAWGWTLRTRGHRGQKLSPHSLQRRMGATSDLLFPILLPLLPSICRKRCRWGTIHEAKGACRAVSHAVLFKTIFVFAPRCCRIRRSSPATGTKPPSLYQHCTTKKRCCQGVVYKIYISHIFFCRMFGMMHKFGLCF